MPFVTSAAVTFNVLKIIYRWTMHHSETLILKRSISLFLFCYYEEGKVFKVFSSVINLDVYGKMMQKIKKLH